MRNVRTFENRAGYTPPTRFKKAFPAIFPPRCPYLNRISRSRPSWSGSLTQRARPRSKQDQPVKLVLDQIAAFAQLVDSHFLDRFLVHLGPVHGPAELVKFVRPPLEIGVLLLKILDLLRMFGKGLMQGLRLFIPRPVLLFGVISR